MTETSCALAAERLREAADLRKEAEMGQRELAQLENEWRSLKGEDEATTARRRAGWQRDCAIKRAWVDSSNRRYIELADEARRHDQDWQRLRLQYRRKQDELGRSLDGPARDEIEQELASMLVQLFLYERDEELLRRAKVLRDGILDRKGLSLVPEDHVRTPAGETVAISKLGDYGGRGVLVYAKGTTVPKDVARQMGWL